MVGLNSGTATALLGYVGLVAEVVGQVASMTVPAGVVVSSSPAHGTLLPGQRVALVVSSGKPKVAIPGKLMEQRARPPLAAAQRFPLLASGLAATETTAYNCSTTACRPAPA